MTCALSVLVVDDENLARSRLKALLAECIDPPCWIEAEASDAMEAIAKLQSRQVDVVLLDIHMPGANGLQLARELLNVRPEVCVVFVTAHPEHAVTAFDLEVTDYLTKPVRAERLRKAMQKAVQVKLLRETQEASRLPADAEKYVVIHDRGRTERVAVSEVLYFKAELKYVTVRTASRSLILDGSLSELETQFNQQFLRIHRNTLVAKHEMRSLERIHAPIEGIDDAASGDGWAVRLRSCSEPLLVSRRQLSAVRAVIAQP